MMRILSRYDLAPSSQFAIDFGFYFSGLRASRVLA